MTLHLSPDVLALNADALAGQKVARIAGSPRIAKADLGADPYDSGLNRRFAAELADVLFVPGEWAYEPITLHIAGGLYTPDFFGPLADGRGLAAVEVKGWAQSQDRSKAKFRAAVEQHKWLTFGWVVWSKRSGWEQQWYWREGR